MNTSKIFVNTLFLTVIATITAFAGSWGKDAKGWWYLNDDGTYAKSEWK